jgi:hypothetical protein
MLGNHADHFMLAQMNERVSAMTPNAGGRSLSVPDRERAGSAHVTVRGGFAMPGPQRTVGPDYSPGRGSPLPGMGGVFGAPGGFIPLAGPDGFIPLGDEAAPQGVQVNLTTPVLIGWGLIAAGLVYFLGKRSGEEHHAAPAPKA